LRPQLIDRFGLMVGLQNCFEPQVRQQIVKARLAFDLDPQGFRAGYTQQQETYVQRIHAAREVLPQLDFDDAVHAHVSALCIDAAVDGLRADLVMLRAARALAALEQAAAVTTEHVERVAESVLMHRRHDRETRAGGDARESEAPRQVVDDADAASSPSSLDSTSSAAAAGDSDWGYLSPQPAGVAQVKGVIPLNAKKR
jgi:magnesium chelatase subunit I